MPKLNKFVTDFRVDLALMSITGSLVGVRRTGYTKETALVTICPTCEAPTKVSQAYTCPHGHGPFKVGECDKAKETNGNFKRVDPDDVKAAKKSELPPNVLELSVHSATDVDAQTYPSEHAYVFYPAQASKQSVLLRDVVGNPQLAFIGMCNIRNSEKLLQVRAWGDNLVVQSLMFPEELNERSVDDEPDVDEKFRAMTSLFENMVEEFDANAYRNTKREKLAALVSDGVALPAASPAGVPADSDDVALEKLYAALNKKKKGAK